MKTCLPLVLALTLCNAQEPCVMTSAPREYRIGRVKGAPKLDLNERSKVWRRASAQTMWKACQTRAEYPEIKTTIKAFWTETDLYVLFISPYKKLNLFLPPDKTKARVKLWDRDVVELFIGDDFQNIRRYREFEIAPTGDWIDLAIDLDHKSFDASWRSGWETRARIDENARIWYAAARIPLKSISEHSVKPGTRWRLNFYRIDGPGGNATRRFLCWLPTCDAKHGNHVPESFGTLVFRK